MLYLAKPLIIIELDMREITLGKRKNEAGAFYRSVGLEDKERVLAQGGSLSFSVHSPFVRAYSRMVRWKERYSRFY